MISSKVAHEVLETALAKGGDFAEIFLEDTTKNFIEMTSGELQVRRPQTFMEPELEF